ncbi:microtubule-associated protein 1B-like [Patiria miniata]|uniref:Uncharacterized protein n=1 Tax=Patiria miniata TaxID=46514 RepID=A0A914ART2_PATMI|nr:microtubule-associated protein 1B-like [Patiria miniata]
MGNKLEHPSVELPPEKLVMVTGGNTGIGYETAKSIAKMGARVCITSRSEDKAKAAIERMQTEHRAEMQQRSHGQASSPSTSEEVEIKPLNVEYIKVDLASLQSTMDFIQETKERMQYLNILVCNAGIAFAKQEYTEDKYESQFQVNYLSHLLIVLHLMPLLQAGSPDSRIVLLSSEGHSSGKLDLDNMQGRKSFSRYTAYASSKAYMVMAAHFLARRLEGTGVSTFSTDPGFVDTNIMNNFSDWKLMSFYVGAYKKFGMIRTPKQGAATSVVACVDPSLRGKTAVYLKNCRPANPASFCWDGKKQEDLWSYSLGCLNQFISDDVLKEAFPSARTDLLIIPKDTRTVEEKIVDDPGKRDGRSDDKQMGDQSKAGKASLERKQDEEQPEIESSPGAAEEASEKPKAPQDSSAASAEEKMPEVAPRDDEKECETSYDKKQIEEHPEKESSFAEVPTKEVKTEETSRQESEESMLKDSPPEQIEEEPSKESSAGTPETGQTSEDPKADAEVPSESLKTSKEPQAKEIDDASKEGTAGAASAEIKQMEGQPEREPSAEAAPEIEQTAESPKADAEVPTEGLQTSREPSGQKSEERGVTDDAANEETAVAASSDSKQVEEQPDEEASAEAAPEIEQTAESPKADAEVPTEGLQTSREPSGQKSEERGVTDDAANEETAVAASSDSKQVEEQPDEEASARAGSEIDQTSEDLKADAEVPAESLQTSKEPSGRKSEERGVTDDAANEETAVAASLTEQVEEQPDEEASAEAAPEIEQTAESPKADAEVPTEGLQTSREPSGQKSEERGVTDDAANEETAVAASSDSKQVEEQPDEEASARAGFEIDQTSEDLKADAKVPAESLQTSQEPSGRKSEERGVTDDAANEETAVAASLTEQVEEQPDEEASARAGSEIDQTSEDLKAAAEVPAESLQTSRGPSGRKSEERGVTDAAANEATAVAASSDKQVEEQPDKEASARAGSEIDQTSEDLEPTESLGTAIKKPRGQESEERDVKDDASTACSVSSENKQMEDQPKGEPFAEATPEIDETSEPKAKNEDTADEVLEFKEDASQLATKEKPQLAPETSTDGEDLSDGQVEEKPTEDTAAAEDSSGMPDADTPTEKPEEGSTEVPVGTSEKTVLTEEDVSVKVEDGEGKPTEGQASQQ